MYNIPMPPEILCIGESCIDVYLPPIDRRFCGGNAVNVAVALASAGQPVGLLSALGSDDVASRFRAVLAQKGVDTRFVQSLPGPTARSHTQLDSRKRPEFLHALNPPRASFGLNEAALDALRSARLVYSSGLRPNLDELGLAAQAGAAICIDYGRRPDPAFLQASLPLTDLAIRSLPEESAGEAPALARALRQAGARIAVVLMSARGAMLDDGQPHFQPPAALPAGAEEILDTLGAGDAWTGAYLAAWLRGEPLEARLRAAASAAALTCRIYGAWPGAELP